jgi:hypothetical protein
MEGLGHGAEVLAQPARLRGADRKRSSRGFAIEAEQLRRTRGRADGSAGRGAVESVLVVARRDRLRDLAFHFDAHLVREHHVEPAAALSLRERQHRGAARARSDA